MTSRETAPKSLFLSFFFLLRDKGLQVTTREWLMFTEALSKGLVAADLYRFYAIARATLVKSEAHYDLFDLCFAHHFAGTPPPDGFAKALDDWLSSPLPTPELSPEDLAALEQHSLEELHKLFEERLNEQDERHDGGNRWIGTGGTSPFGHGGVNPAGIRVGGSGGGRSAVQIAAKRRFQSYRDDLVLDTRQIGIALRRLRRLGREGLPTEVDIDATIDATARNAGDLEVLMCPPRENRLRVLLLMDVGGSMDPYAALVSRLFSAAHQAAHFREFNAYYFHNCVYERVYESARMDKGVLISDLRAQLLPETRVIFVGDAHMAPYELVSQHGAIDYWHQNQKPGIDCLKELATHFERAAWLNPIPQRYWGHPTITMIGEAVDMFELTLAGLTEAIAALN